MKAKPTAQPLLRQKEKDNSDGEDKGEGGSEDEGEEEFVDDRWRLISLTPHSQHWQEVLESLDSQELSSFGEHAQLPCREAASPVPTFLVFWEPCLSPQAVYHQLDNESNVG